MSDKLRGLVVCAAMLGATASPLLRAPSDDGFPLSTFPMFSRARARTEQVTSALLLADDGSERVVPARYISGTEPMQAVSVLGRSVAAGRREAGKLCRGIAERVARSGDRDLAGGREVILTTRRIDAIAFLAGEPAVSERTEHARCPLHPKAKAKR